MEGQLILLHVGLNRNGKLEYSCSTLKFEYHSEDNSTPSSLLPLPPSQYKPKDCCYYIILFQGVFNACQTQLISKLFQQFSPPHENMPHKKIIMTVLFITYLSFLVDKIGFCLKSLAHFSSFLFFSSQLLLILISY